MRTLILILSLLFCISCRNDTKEKVSQQEKDSEKLNTNWEQKLEEKEQEAGKIKYQNKKWNFSFNYPEGFQVLESELSGGPVINIYSQNDSFNPPFGIHEEAENAYLAILPEGLAVDGPSGETRNLKEWDGEIPNLPALNIEESNVYLLNSGEAWAFFFRFKNPPANWKDHAVIFVHFPVKNFDARCFDKDGNEKTMQDCQELGGGDQVRYYGELEVALGRKILDILESFKFENANNREISDLIRVESPLPNIEITSPLKVKGKARGYWFFEADAPIVLLDKDGKKLGESFITAKGSWMTEDFVDFSGNIQFDAPDDERGYLVFKRANPSDKTENDREYRIPVLFPPK